LHLADYLTATYTPARERGRQPDQILIADVLSVYADDVAGRHARPKEAAARLERVLDYFGNKRLASVTGATCRAYAGARGNGAAARRELEDFRAAINHYHREGFVAAPVAVTLPDKSEPRTRWLTRSEAAALIKAAWRMRQSWRGDQSERRTGQHVARFILVALYTGTRAGAVCGAAIRPTIGRGYVDLERGVFYRRAPGSRETKKRQPAVRLPDRLLAHLRRWERKGFSKAAVIEWNGTAVERIPKAFRTAREAAGLGGDVVPHTLRHTAATWLMQNGCDLWEAAGYLGMSVETLEKVYGHHHPGHHEGARRAITYRDRTGTDKREPKRNTVA
jgi:integrase